MKNFHERHLPYYCAIYSYNIKLMGVYLLFSSPSPFWEPSKIFATFHWLKAIYVPFGLETANNKKHAIWIVLLVQAFLSQPAMWFKRCYFYSIEVVSKAVWVAAPLSAMLLVTGLIIRW